MNDEGDKFLFWFALTALALKAVFWLLVWGVLIGAVVWLWR